MNTLQNVGINILIIVSIVLYIVFDYVRYIVTIQHCAFVDYQCKRCKDENMICNRRKKVSTWQ